MILVGPLWSTLPTSTWGEEEIATGDTVDILESFLGSYISHVTTFKRNALAREDYEDEEDRLEALRSDLSELSWEIVSPEGRVVFRVDGDEYL